MVKWRVTGLVSLSLFYFHIWWESESFMFLVPLFLPPQKRSNYSSLGKAKLSKLLGWEGCLEHPLCLGGECKGIYLLCDPLQTSFLKNGAYTRVSYRKMPALLICSLLTLGCACPFPNVSFPCCASPQEIYQKSWGGGEGEGREIFHNDSVLPVHCVEWRRRKHRAWAVIWRSGGFFPPCFTPSPS